jgi:benzoyl-CoA reductase/2-hydroxyglutaryl-CoA dehydratase subunit BcrC/BadD/HgdB
VRGTRQGSYGLGFTAFTEKKVIPAASTRYYYRELLKQIVEMMRSGQSPLSGEEMVEVVAFQEAANASMSRAGGPVAIES